MPPLVRQVGNLTLDLYGKLRALNYDVTNTIVISSTGRAGSSWLADIIISSLPRYHLLWEPLHNPADQKSSTYGFGKELYIPVGGGSETQKQILRDTLTGRRLSANTKTQIFFRPERLLALKGYVAKFVTSNMFLPWLVAELPVRAIFLLRHPCASVASQLKYEDWAVHDKKYYADQILFDHFPHLNDLYDRISSREELLAFDWARQNYVPLKSQPPHRWIATTYEDLVLDGRKEIQRIFEALKEEIPRKLNDLLIKPSKTTRKESDYFRKRKVDDWKTELSSTQIDKIMSVVWDAGIREYTDVST